MSAIAPVANAKSHIFVLLFTECASVFCGSWCASASRYSCTENVRVIPIVVPELEFRDIQRQIFAADLVEASHDAALQQRPEAIDCLRMHHAIDVTTARIPHEAMRKIVFQIAIARMFVGRDQTDLFGYGLANKPIKRIRISVVNHAGNDVAFASDRADDDAFVAKRTGLLFVPMAIFVLSADVSFVNLDNTHELAEIRVGEASADTMAHIPSRPIRTETHHAMDLQSRNTFLAGQHKIDDFEPRLEPDVRVFENRSDQHREPIAALGNAFGALPMEGPSRDRVDVLVTTARANDALGPSASDQVLLTGVISRKQLFKLRDRHLRGEFDAHSGDSHA